MSTTTNTTRNMLQTEQFCFEELFGGMIICEQLLFGCGKIQHDFGVCAHT